VAPIFREWIEPFRSLGMSSVTIRNTGGTDHQSYDALALPGFQFIQDDVEYNTMTHHTNLDSYERLQPSDMMKNATIAASFAYLTANRDEKLPRKPFPAATAGRGGRGSGQYSSRVQTGFRRGSDGGSDWVQAGVQTGVQGHLEP
jgi:carboxypeptidase Q